jgi:phosphohistidine phosphatase SixA
MNVSLHRLPPCQVLHPGLQHSPMGTARRTLYAALLCAMGWLSWPALAAGGAAQPSNAQSNLWQALQRGGIVVFRHATAPGGGDPAGFVLGNCSTQRNLDATGRQQAQRLGDLLRSQSVAVGAVWASQWCRTRETAQLAFPTGPAVTDQPVFNSFFANTRLEPAQTAAARRLLLNWSGPGALVVVTHQVNITALTGVFPQSGEGVVLQLAGNELKVVGRIAPVADKP